MPEQGDKEYSDFHWTPEDTERFWNFESRYPERYFTYRNGAEMVRQLKAYLPDTEPILDYGCGAGHMLRHLVDKGYRAAGTDSSQSAVEFVNAQLGSHDNFIGAFLPQTIRERQQAFGAVLVTEVVEHLYDDALSDLLESVKGLVKDTGQIIITTPNEENLEESQLLCPCCNQVFHRWQHVRRWSKDTLSDYLEARGFTVLGAFTTDFRIPFENKDHGWWRLKKKFSRRKKPGKCRPHLAIVCKPK